MEKRSYISPAQAVLVLFITRLLLFTSYQSVLKMGNSIQDILLSLPVNLVTNFIVAIPFLILLKRQPGHDPVECTKKAGGRCAGTVVAVLYYLFFLLNAALVAGNYENSFADSVIPNVPTYIVGIFLLVVCVYGALKGIETIARVGSVVAVIYIAVFAVILVSAFSVMNFGFLKPMLYDGPKYLLSGSLMNYNLSIQIAVLAFIAPFLRRGTSTGKLYAVWNVLSIAMMFIIEFAIVTTMGPYGAKQIYPVENLSTLSHISAFERLDSLDMISWILNTVISVTMYLYLAVSCLLRAGLNGHRKLVLAISGVAVFVFASFIADNFSAVQSASVSLAVGLAVTVFIVVIPLVILFMDIIKGRVMQNEQNR